MLEDGESDHNNNNNILGSPTVVLVEERKMRRDNSDNKGRPSTLVRSFEGLASFGVGHSLDSPSKADFKGRATEPENIQVRDRTLGTPSGYDDSNSVM